MDILDAGNWTLINCDDGYNETGDIRLQTSKPKSM